MSPPWPSCATARAVLELQPHCALARSGHPRRLAAATSSSFALFESPDKRNESDPSRLSFLPPSVWRRACPDGSSLRRVQTSPSTSPSVVLGATFTISVTPWPQSMRSFDIVFPSGRRCEASSDTTKTGRRNKFRIQTFRARLLSNV